MVFELLCRILLEAKIPRWPRKFLPGADLPQIRESSRANRAEAEIFAPGAFRYGYRLSLCALEISLCAEALHGAIDARRPSAGAAALRRSERGRPAGAESRCLFGWEGSRFWNLFPAVSGGNCARV